jgi:hypothetical protein
MKPLTEDIQAGYAWVREQGKVVKFYGQLVGPTRTAMSKRVGEGWKSNDRKPVHQPEYNKDF